MTTRAFNKYHTLSRSCKLSRSNLNHGSAFNIYDSQRLESPLNHSYKLDATNSFKPESDSLSYSGEHNGSIISRSTAHLDTTDNSTSSASGSTDDASTSSSTTICRVLYDYKANMEDELTISSGNL